MEFGRPQLPPYKSKMVPASQCSSTSTLVSTSWLKKDQPYILRDSAVRFSHVAADAHHSLIAHGQIEAVQQIAGARSCNIISAYLVLYCYQQDHGTTFVAVEVAVQYLFIGRRPRTIFETRCSLSHIFQSQCGDCLVQQHEPDAHWLTFSPSEGICCAITCI